MDGAGVVINERLLIVLLSWHHPCIMVSLTRRYPGLWKTNPLRNSGTRLISSTIYSSQESTKTCFRRTANRLLPSRVLQSPGSVRRSVHHDIVLFHVCSDLLCQETSGKHSMQYAARHFVLYYSEALSLLAKQPVHQVRAMLGLLRRSRQRRRGVLVWCTPGLRINSITSTAHGLFCFPQIIGQPERMSCSHCAL